VARRDRRGGAEEVRALPALRGAAVDAIAVHGGALWLGLSAMRDGAPAPLGLVRYDWARDRVRAFRGTDSGPCGFFVHDLLVHEDTLWVATDLGVSRLGLSPDTWDEWTHFAPGPEPGETACATLLGRVLDARAAPAGEAAARWLAEFRPRFWKRHSRRTKSRGTSPALRRDRPSSSAW
jgi:hypothetical protein